MKPVYILAGQSNAGSLTLAQHWQSLLLRNEEFLFLSLIEGGTALTPTTDRNDWFPIADSDPSTGELFEQLVSLISNALAVGDTYLAGVVFVQGEQDTNREEATVNYATLLTAFHEGLIEEFGSEFHFSIVALPSRPALSEDITEYVYWTEIREQQFMFATDRLNTTLIDPDPLSQSLLLKDVEIYRDHIHYTTTFSDALLRTVLATFPGSQFSNTGIVQGNAGHDTVRGSAENDFIAGLLGDDYLIAREGNDILLGGDGNDSLFGGDGDDTLFGGAGTDFMAGGAGDDLYYIDDLQDNVIERADEGRDTVITSVGSIASTHVEAILAAQQSGPLRLTGNDLANTIVGGSGNDTLLGLSGDDDLTGGDGDDILQGNDSNDRLTGSLGADRLFGGAGNDFYVVDDDQDKIVELSNEGRDTISAKSEFVLRGNAEIEVLLLHRAAGAAGLTGNATSQTLNGNEFANRLDGRGGIDRLFGRDGDDRLLGADGYDSLYGGTGTDTLFGGAGNDYLDGEAGVDVMYGGDGNDTLVGSGGDHLYGGSGSDQFVFGNGSGRNTIRDFDPASDLVHLLDYNLADADKLELRQVGSQLWVLMPGTDRVIVMTDILRSDITSDIFLI